MKTVLFHTPTLNFRGSCVALYDYANYNESILGNRSLILTDYRRMPEHNTKAFRLFSNRFPVLFYKTPSEIPAIIERYNGNVLYMIKYGKKTDDDIPVDALDIKTIVHCVFDMTEPHGTEYIAVSSTLAFKFNRTEFLPHMVSLNPITRPSFRNALGIPENAFVFGRHGGKDTFNLEFAKNVISEVIRIRQDLHFVFLNAPKWDDHPNIHYLPAMTDVEMKQKFILTCDAMIVPETMGHTFGLSIAEFSMYNKPIVCYNGNVWNRSHLDILGNKGIYFDNPATLKEILLNITARDIEGKNWNAYSDFTPSKVMIEFEKLLD